MIDRPELAIKLNTAYWAHFSGDGHAHHDDGADLFDQLFIGAVVDLLELVENGGPDENAAHQAIDATDKEVQKCILVVLLRELSGVHHDIRGEQIRRSTER